MWCDILTNIISDIIFLLLLIAIGWIILFLTRRYKLLSFFNIRRTKKISIYLSNIRVIPGGAIGIDDTKRNYGGKAVTFSESQAARSFTDIFNYLVPSALEKPGILSKLLISDVHVQIEPSPLDYGFAENNSSIIALGSPGYNAISRFIEEVMVSRAKFINDNSGMLVEGFPPIQDTKCGFVERVLDSESGRSIFYAAGLSEPGTVGAALFLSREWKMLHKKYGGSQPFVVMLRFDITNLKNWTILFEQ